MAGRVGGIARSAWRDAEFLLAERAAFLLLRLRDLRRLGGWEGASEGGIKMAGVGLGEASFVGLSRYTPGIVQDAIPPGISPSTEGERSLDYSPVPPSISAVLFGKYMHSNRR